jgi:hypothetical protein
MLFGEIIAVHFENHTELLDTLFWQNEEFVFHRKIITSPQQTQQVRWFEEIVAVYCVNHTEQKIHCVGRMQRLYLTGNKLLLHYKAQTVRLFGKTFTVYCEKHTEKSDTLCEQNSEFVPHRKRISSPLQIATG